MADHMDSRTRDRLKGLCKVGRLFDAQRLLDEVGTARLRKTRKWSPLFTAVDRGFHSLVELLLRYDHAQWDLEKAYEGAHRRGRADLAALILSSRSWTAPINPVEVLATGDVDLARKLHDAGTDFTSGGAILQAAIRNVSGTLKIVNELKLRSGEVENQLYAALVSHASEGHVASVVRFLRAGFDPHRPVRYLDERGRYMEEEDSAVHVAMYSGKPGFFAMLKPNPERDDAVALIQTAVFLGDNRLLKVLLDAGFKLNCKPNGGSPALDEVFAGRTLKYRVPLPYYGQRNEQPRYPSAEADAFIRGVESFIKQGARWVPDLERNELRMTRDTLLALGDINVVRLFKILDEHGAASREDLKKLLSAERMKPMARVMRTSLGWG